MQDWGRQGFLGGTICIQGHMQMCKSRASGRGKWVWLAGPQLVDLLMFTPCCYGAGGGKAAAGRNRGLSSPLCDHLPNLVQVSSCVVHRATPPHTSSCLHFTPTWVAHCLGSCQTPPHASYAVAARLTSNLSLIGMYVDALQPELNTQSCFTALSCPSEMPRFSIVM